MCFVREDEEIFQKLVKNVLLFAECEGSVILELFPICDLSKGRYHSKPTIKMLRLDSLRGVVCVRVAHVIGKYWTPGT